MKNLSELTYGIVGLGIMGGSIAKAIRTKVISEPGKTKGRIYALDKSIEPLYAAIDSKVIDKGFQSDKTAEMLKACDFVFICLYPHAIVDFLKANKMNFKNDAVITDISGVKAVLEKNYNLLCPPNADLILGHPMAGGEKEGFNASKGEYFINHNYLVIPHKNNNPENIALFKELIHKMGFSKITETTSADHDNKIGFTSQLCHVVASAMVESAENTEITSFGGGSFEDLTRIAMINAPLWTELFISNKELLVNHIENFKEQITILENLIKNEDSEGLKDLLNDVRKKRVEMQNNK